MTSIPVTVTEVVNVTPMVKRFHLAPSNGSTLPAFSGGAHVTVEMPDGDHVRRNPYSLMSSPLDRSFYAISVRREDEGRGGSRFMHEKVEPGMELTISPPVNLFALNLTAKKHLMIAGGIGITPFMAQIAQLSELGAENFELHYKARSAPMAAYMDVLTAHFGDKVHAYCSDRGDVLDHYSLLASQPLGTHLYVCGPQGMIDHMVEEATALGWPNSHIHTELFAAPPTGEPFRVTLARSGLDIDVGAQESLLEAIEAAGVDAPYLCRGGACGQCETNVVSCQGELLHNDHWLSEDERQAGEKIMPCVSRFKGETLVIDR